MDKIRLKLIAKVKKMLDAGKIRKISKDADFEKMLFTIHSKARSKIYYI